MNAVSGTFSYPPPHVQFDYSDSVVASWTTNDSYATEAVLTLSYYEVNWTISVIEAVSANGSKSVALDIGTNLNYLGQFHIYYNANDGSQQKYASPIFNVVHHTGEISPSIWNQQALSTTSAASGTASTHLTAPTTSSTSNSATTLASTSTGTSHKNSHLAAGVGLGLGIAFGIFAICLVGFLYWVKKNKRNPLPQDSRGMSQKPATFVDEVSHIGELDGHHRHLEMPAGPLDAELDCGRPAC